MANNTYGTVRPSLIEIDNDVEVWYHYRPSRSSTDENFKNFQKINTPSSVLKQTQIESGKPLVGMYNLTLPVSIFGKKGFYTIYIKPKEEEVFIHDIGSLAAFPDIKGIVLNEESITGNLRTLLENDNLTGYRIEYYENNERKDYYRIITSCNKCEPVSQNLTSANTNSNGYRFNPSGSLCFLTVTPSTSPSFKSNAKPFIGTPNQKIVIVNTKFDPVMIEVEMVEHDIETLSVMVEGDQIRNLEKGTVTTYNFEGEIYKQQEFFTLKDNYNKNNVYEVKRNKEDIDVDLNLDEIDT